MQKASKYSFSAHSKTLFIADLHLSAEREDITECFFVFLKNDAIQADALYILGDLFEIWLGDDDVNSHNSAVAAALKKAAEHTNIYFIHGNRDFAIRTHFANKAGMILLPEQCVIDLYGTSTLIMHGDELCTLDIEYQKFRKKARGWWWPTMMRSLPLWLRRHYANKGRQKSIKNQKTLTTEIMDVTPNEVVKVMALHNVLHLIHGHTHRCHIHTLTINGKEAKRYVLGDWYDQGSVLVATPTGLFMQTRPFFE